MKHSSFAKFFSAILLFLCLPLQAQLAIDKIIIEFDNESSGKNDVTLVNSGQDETLYVKIDVLEVSDPGTPEEKRFIADDPFKIGLIASPTKVIIPPNSKRLVRLVNLFPATEKERIFRVNFTPVAGEEETEGTSVRLMVGYQALVIVRPEKTVFDLVGKREGKKLVLTNNSNTNVYLDSVRQCKTEKLEECESLSENRLYPGNTWEVELTGNGPVAFNADDGLGRKAMTY